MVADNGVMAEMKFGIVITDRDPARFAEWAQRAEQAGWDAVFSWETHYGFDAWIALAAAATATSTLRLGTMLTPLPKWRPWQLASVTRTLDQLSGGRVILACGIGALHEGWTAFEDDPGRSVRAAQMDEVLDILFGLWGQGAAFGYDGTHYRVRPTELFQPGPPVATPRITTWCVGMVGAPKSLARAARCDGLLPAFRGHGPDTSGLTLDDWAEAVTQITAMRGDAGFTTPYDVIAEADHPLTERARSLEWAAELGERGYTWYVDSSWGHLDQPDEADVIRARIDAGPPRSA